MCFFFKQDKSILFQNLVHLVEAKLMDDKRKLQIVWDTSFAHYSWCHCTARIPNNAKVAGNRLGQFHVTALTSSFCVTMCVTSNLKQQHFFLMKLYFPVL
jgi:hypothetical protein